MLFPSSAPFHSLDRYVHPITRSTICSPAEREAIVAIAVTLVVAGEADAPLTAGVVLGCFVRLGLLLEERLLRECRNAIRRTRYLEATRDAGEGAP